MGLFDKLKKFDFFWETMELCDWNKEGDDKLVLAPVINHLASKEDSDIFMFDDLMSELLYNLDTKKLAEQCKNIDGYMSDDSFLYSRCVALINGIDYYKKARMGRCKEMWKMEFESLLYVPESAWAKKHNKPESEYPHVSSFSYETGSNTGGWK